MIYVEELIGPDTVNTMPEETIDAFQDHGEVALTLERDLDEAQRVFDGSRRPGSTTTTWSSTLEREGVEKFSDSFTELLDGVGPSEASWSRPERAGAGICTRRSPVTGRPSC